MQMRRRIEKLDMAVLSFFVPFIIIILCYIALHIEPFGEHTLIISDARGLYASDLMYIARALRGQEDILYSFKSGIGMNMMGANCGLLNPANSITLLFDITSLPTLYSLLMAIDISFCGLTMYCFLSNVYGRNGKNLIFSTIYAMMGFNVAYCYHYNFILSPELLPLIALGIHRIIEGKSPWLYIASLCYAVLASFYFGFMLCIASVVIFLFWYVRDHDRIRINRRKIWINYTAASLVAGLLPAVVWVAALLSFSGGRLNQNSILDFSFEENMSLSAACAKFFIGANNTSEQINGQPNVFIGSLALFLNFAFFVDRRNSFRKKVIYAAPLVFYFVTFYIRAFSMVVQGFSATNWFNYRYSFVFSFLMILIAFEEFAVLRSMERADFKKTCGVFAVFVLLVFGQRYSYVTGGGMLLGMALLCASLGVIWWNRIDPKRAPSNLLVILLVLLCSVESYANYFVCTGALRDWESEPSEYKDDLFAGSIISDAIRQLDPSFYRMASEHSTNQLASNDPRLFGYNGLISFGSCERDDVYHGLTKLGMSRWNNRMWYTYGKPSAFDALLGVKYVVSEQNLAEEKGYEYLVNMGDYDVYRNPYALPIAVLAAPESEAVTLGLNPFENHNALWKSITGENKDVFEIQDDIEFVYHTGNDGEIVDYSAAKAYSASVSADAMNSADDQSGNSVSVSESDAAERNIDAIRQNYHIECSFVADHDGPVYGYNGLSVDEKNGYAGEALYYLGYYHKGETVTDYISLNGAASKDVLNMVCAEYSAACADQSVLELYSQKLQNGAGLLEKHTDSYLSGNITAQTEGRLFFTIPFDEGWTLMIDGVEIPLNKTADLFMSAPVQEGEHSYELHFLPKGMRTGMYLSISAVVLLIALAIYNIVARKQRKR